MLHLAVRVLLRLLAEVPDVPVTVLGVPVERVLDHLAVLAHDVVHDRGGDAEDLLRLVGDGDLDLLLAALAVGLAVDPAAARSHRPVRVVDPRDEVRRVELGRLAPLRERLLRLPAAASCEQEGCGEEREGAPSRRRRHRRRPGPESSSASLPIDLEVGVQVDLDLAPVGELDLDAVGGAVVAGLGLDDRAAAGVRERGRRWPARASSRSAAARRRRRAAIARPADRTPASTTTAPISSELAFSSATSSGGLTPP